MGRNAAYGDDVYQPQDDGALDHTGQLDMEDALGEPNADDLLDSGYSPPERPRVCGRYGTTDDEQLHGETLQQRMAQEEPDNQESSWSEDPDNDASEGDDDGQVGSRRAGRIAYSDADSTWDVVGRDVGIDGGAASAEEAAMHVVDPQY